MIKDRIPIVFNLDNRYLISHKHSEYYKRVIDSVLLIYQNFKSSERFRNSEGSIEFEMNGLFLGISIETIIELKYMEKESLDFGEIFCTEISKKKLKNRKYNFTFDKGVNFKQMSNMNIRPNICYVYNYIIEAPPSGIRSYDTNSKILDIKNKLKEIDKKLRRIEENQ